MPRFAGIPHAPQRPQRDRRAQHAQRFGSGQGRAFGAAGRQRRRHGPHLRLKARACVVKADGFPRRVRSRSAIHRHGRGAPKRAVDLYASSAAANGGAVGRRTPGAHGQRGARSAGKTQRNTLLNVRAQPVLNAHAPNPLHVSLQCQACQRKRVNAYVQQRAAAQRRLRDAGDIRHGLTHSRHQARRAQPPSASVLRRACAKGGVRVHMASASSRPRSRASQTGFALGPRSASGAFRTACLPASSAARMCCACRGWMLPM